MAHPAPNKAQVILAPARPRITGTKVSLPCWYDQQIDRSRLARNLDSLTAPATHYHL